MTTDTSIQTKKMKARELLEQIAKEIDERIEKLKLRWVYLEEDEENNKTKIWRNNEVIAEVDEDYYSLVEELNSAYIDEVYSIIDEVLEKYEKMNLIKIDRNYYNDDPFYFDSFGSYGKWTYYVVDRAFELKIEDNEEIEEIESEYTRIYYDDMLNEYIVVVNIQLTAYDKNTEAYVLTTEDAIRNNLNLNPEIFEKY